MQETQRISSWMNAPPKKYTYAYTIQIAQTTNKEKSSKIRVCILTYSRNRIKREAARPTASDRIP